MIKKIIMVCFVALTTMSAMAQVTVNRGNYGTQQQKETSFSDKDSGFLMKYGVKAGLNMTSMSNDMAFEPGFGMGVGFRVGGFLNMRWGYRTENSSKGTGWFGLQPELMYSMQQVGTADKSFKLNIIQVPVMVKIYPTTQLSFEVGPEFSYIISSSPKSMTIADGEVTNDISTGDIKGLNVGIGAGVAYDLDFGLTIGARYSCGFNKMAKNLDWKMGNIQVSLGWLF
jgi:hypothetical protein